MKEIKLDSIGRRIPQRTKEWKDNIGKANTRGKLRKGNLKNVIERNTIKNIKIVIFFVMLNPYLIHIH